MKNILVRRFLAYLLDIFLVACVMYFVSYIPLSRENQKRYEEISFDLVNLMESLEHNEISEETFNQEYIPLSYELNRSNMGNTIINLLLLVLYFGCVPFFMGGQTIGKRLFKLKIVSLNDEESVGIVSYLVRAIILNNVLITIAQLGILSFWNADNYYTLYSNVNLVGFILLYFILLLVLLRRDQRGLHDLIAGTQVISFSEKEIVKPETKKMETKPVSSKKVSHSANPSVARANTTKKKEEPASKKNSSSKRKNASSTTKSVSQKESKRKNKSIKSDES